MDQKKVSKIGAPEALMHGPDESKIKEMIAGKSGIAMQLVAAAVSVVLVAGVLLLTNVGSAAVNTNGTEVGTGPVTVIPKAQEGIGNDIGVHGISSSDPVTISDYYGGGYTTKLDCRLVSPSDSFPVYCDGGPIFIYGLPEGMYTVEITGTSGLEIEPLSISLAIS